MKPDPQRPPVASPRQSAVEQAAWLWAGRMQDDPDAGQREAFERWLYADVRHIDAYAQAEALWRRTWPAAALLADEEADQLRQYLAPRPVPSRRRTRWSAALAMAASLVLMVWVGGWHPLDRLQDLGADYVSAPGEVRTLTLADGSRVVLDADSALSVDYRADERHVVLHRGGAYFQVTHGEPPFVVEAAGGEARVLGTRFGVRLQLGGARVTVEQGRVGVRARADAPQQLLTANQQVRYLDGRGGEVYPVDAEAQLAWRQGRLTFYKTPLADVLDELGRYYPGRILLLDTDLAGQRVSGSFPNNDPRAVVDALGAVLGFQRHEVLGRVMVLR